MLVECFIKVKFLCDVGFLDVFVFVLSWVWVVLLVLVYMVIFEFWGEKGLDCFFFLEFMLLRNKEIMVLIILGLLNKGLMFIFFKDDFCYWEMYK